MSRGHVLGLCAVALACAGTAHAKFMPSNALYLEDRLTYRGGLTEEQFNAVIDRAEAYFKPIIATFGGTYHVERRWDDSTVNADAEQLGKVWNVNMYGGLARRPEVSVDGFALVLCHETGHHLAGFPFTQDWAANEGQSDIFATSHCARTIFGKEPSANAAARAAVPDFAKAKCDAVYSVEADQDLCYRTMIGGKSLADLLGALGGTPAEWQTPDTSEVDETNNQHPQAQCRLDTYIAGALCLAPYDKNVIPGKVGDAGQNDANAERTSAQYYCADASHYKAGFRPRCWFKPGI